MAKPIKRITIYDIARKMGISYTTVSRALRSQQGIAKETIEEVQKVAHEMGYKPNTIASSLRTNKSFSIAVLIPQINRAFISTLISGIEELAKEKGYHVMIYQSHDSEQNEIEIVQSILARKVDGVIISLAMQTNSYDHIQLLLDHHVPTVMCDRVHDGLEIDRVVIDNFNAGFKVTDYLIQTGHQRIAYIGGENLRNIHRDRMEGYIAALKKNNIPVDNDLISLHNLSENHGIKAIDKFMSLPNPPDAIFSGNDTAAVSALLHLQELGYRVPQDISIIGFNNDPIASIVRPKLSTVQHPAYEIGRQAVERLLFRLEDPNQHSIPAKTITLKTSLDIKSSCTERIPTRG